MRRLLPIVLHGLVASLALPAQAQEYVTGWGAMAVDSRWHDRSDAIALRTSYNCTGVLRGDGTVAVIGNDTGRLCRVPPPAAGTRYTMFALTITRGIALQDNGVLVHWGPTFEDPKLPTGVTYVALYGGAGPLHALRSDGSVVNWSSAGGQVVPANVAAVPVVQIAVGGDFSLARRSDGSVVGWNQVTIPALPPGTTYTDIAAGQEQGLLLRSDGTIVPLGTTQLGLANVPVLPGGVTYTQVWCANWHNLARRSDGVVVAWGDNQFGQCTLPSLPPGVTWVDFSGGFGFTSGRRSDGRIVSWGWNRNGECNIPPLPAGVRYSDVSMMWDVILLTRSDGQLVHMGERTSNDLSLIPALPPGLTYVRGVAGNQHCLAMRSDGSIVGWGNNAYGQCTVPPLPAGVSWVKTATSNQCSIGLRSNGTIVVWGALSNLSTPPALPPGVTYVDVAANRWDALALRSDGQVVSWGDNTYGQASPPVLPTGLRYERIGIGANYCLAWRSDGAIVGWGNNTYGQASAAPLPAGVTYTGLAAGGIHGAALRSDGSAVVWGNNQYGQRPAPALPSGLAYTFVATGDSVVIAGVGPGRSYVRSGSGCAGTLPVARLVPFTAPALGKELRVEISNLPAGIALLMTGWSWSTSVLGPLPASAAPVGMPGCTLWGAQDVMDVVVGTGSRAIWSWAIPALPSLAGAQFVQQALVPDPAYGNALHAVLSDAAAAEIGW